MILNHTGSTAGFGASSRVLKFFEGQRQDVEIAKRALSLGTWSYPLIGPFAFPVAFLEHFCFVPGARLEDEPSVDEPEVCI